MDKNDVTLRIGADASGVEAGVNRSKKSIESLGRHAKKASADVAGMGDGGEKAAKKIERETKSMERSLQTLLAKLEGGSREAPRYWEKLADLKGADKNALRPLLDQLEQIRPKAEDAAKSTGGLAASLSGLKSVAASALAGFTVGAVASEISNITRETARAAAEFERFALLSNTSVHEFQRLAAGAATAGVSTEKMADIFKDMQDKVGDFMQTGGGGMADFFEQIAPKVGVTAESFRKLSGKDALQLYVSSLEKANLSHSDMIFYLEAVASDSSLLLPLLQSQGKAWAELGDKAEAYGAILGSGALSAAKDFKAESDNLNLAMQGLRGELAENLLPSVTKLTKGLTEATVGIASAIDTVGEAAAKNRVAINAVLGGTAVIAGAKAAALAVGGVTAALTAARVATIGFTAALAANPIGAALVAVTALGAAAYTAATEIDGASDSVDGLGADAESSAKRIKAMQDAAKEAAAELVKAEKELAALEARGAKGSQNLMLREAYNHAQRLVDKLREAKKAQDALAGGGLADAYTEGMGNNLGIAQRRDRFEASEQFLLSKTAAANGVNKQFLDDLKGYSDALDTGAMSAADFTKAITDLNVKRHASTEAGKAEAAALRESGTRAKGGESAYQSLAKTIEEKIAAQQQELIYGTKLSELDKLQMRASKELSGAKRAELLAKLEIAKADEKELEARAAFIAAMEVERKARLDAYAVAEGAVDSLKEGNERLREEVELIGLSEEAQQAIIRSRMEATIAVKEQHLAEITRANDVYGFMSREQIALRAEIDLLKERLVLLGDKSYKEDIKRATDEQTRHLERGYDQVAQSLTDQLMEGGRDFGEYLENLARTLVFRPVIEGVVNSGLSAIGLGGSGTAGGGIAGMANNAQSLYSAFSGGLTTSVATGIGSIGATIGSSMMTNFAAGMVGGAQMAAPVGMGIGSMGATASTGALGAGAGFATALPWLAGGLAIYSLASSLFGKETPHAGAASQYAGGAITGAGKQYTRDAINADYLSDMQGTVDGLAMTLGSSLDAISKTFGGIGGYSVTAGFKSDDDDPSNGMLQITTAQGEDLVKWLAQRSGEYGSRKTGQSYASDPTEGYDDYMTAVTAAMIPALKAEAPAWADNMLDAFGKSIGFDGSSWKSITATGADAAAGLQGVVQQIVSFQAAIKSLGETMPMMAGLSDDILSQMLGASGSPDAFASVLNGFYTAFTPEAERLEHTFQRLQDAVGIDPRLGDEAAAAYKQLVTDTMAAGNGALAMELMAMGPAFKEATDKAKALTPELTAIGAALSDVMIDLMADRKSLEADLLRAGGDEAGAAAARRTLATEGYTEAERAAWDYNTALQAQIDALDAAAAKQSEIDAQRYAMDGQVLQLLGDTAGMRARELAALDQSLHAQQQYIWTLEDAATAAQSAAAAQQQLQQTARGVLQSHVSLAQEHISALQTTISEAQGKLSQLASDRQWAAEQAGRAYGQAGVQSTEFLLGFAATYEQFAGSMGALADGFAGLEDAQKAELNELEKQKSAAEAQSKTWQDILNAENQQLTQLMSIETAIGVLTGAVQSASFGTAAGSTPTAEQAAQQASLVASASPEALQKLIAEAAFAANKWNDSLSDDSYTDVGRKNLEGVKDWFVDAVRAALPSGGTAKITDWLSVYNTSGQVASNLADLMPKAAEPVATVAESAATVPAGISAMTIAEYRQLAQMQMQYWQLEGDQTSIRKATLASMHPLLQAMQEQLWLTEAQQKQLETFNGAMSSLGDTRFDLEQQILEQQGRTGEAATLKRARDLDKLMTGITDIDMQEQVVAAYDFNKLLEDQVKGWQDLGGSMQGALDSVLDSYNRNLADMASIVKGVKDWTEELQWGDLSGLSDEDKHTSLSYRYADTQARAAAGDKTAMSELQEIAAQLAKLTQESAVSSADYSVWAGRLATSLGSTADMGHQAYIDEETRRAQAWAAMVAGMYSSIPGFASGGLHSGGIRLVGERGPELEVTGPARYFDASTTARMFQGGGQQGGNAELVAENRELRNRVESLEKHMARAADAMETMSRHIAKVTDNGNAMLVVTPEELA